MAEETPHEGETGANPEATAQHLHEPEAALEEQTAADATPAAGDRPAAATAAFPQAEAMGRDAVERAAQLLDQLSERINQRLAGLGKDAGQPVEQADVILHDTATQAEAFATALGVQALRLFARAREEAEDIWAEAQHLREQSRH